MPPTREERAACRASCTYDTCPLVISYWSYRPNVPLNAAFAGLFGLYAITVLLLGIYVKKFRTYTAVIFVGQLMEVFGFIARVYAHAYPFSDVSLEAIGYRMSNTDNNAGGIHHADGVPNASSSFYGRWHLLLLATSRPHILRRAFENTTDPHPAHLHHLRCHWVDPAGCRRCGVSIHGYAREATRSG